MVDPIVVRLRLVWCKIDGYERGNEGRIERVIRRKGKCCTRGFFLAYHASGSRQRHPAVSWIFSFLVDGSSGGHVMSCAGKAERLARCLEIARVASVLITGDTYFLAAKRVNVLRECWNCCAGVLVTQLTRQPQSPYYNNTHIICCFWTK